MNRRKFINLGLGAAALEIGRGFTQANAQVATMTPKQAGGQCGIKVGSAIAKVQLDKIPGLKGLFAKNFNLLTPNGELKWYAVHPAPDTYNFADADYLSLYCQQNGIGLRGHNLCWNTGNPPWVTNTVNASNARQILEQHIQTVAGHFVGKINSWDVVNEPIGIWFNRPDGLYTGPWLNALGPEYIDIAFQKTKEVDPVPLRVLNIHNVDHADGDSDKARQAAINLVRNLMSRKVPIQAVGLESHLDAGRPWDPEVTKRFVATLAGFGLEVFITELDVNDTRVAGDARTRDKAVADLYYNYLLTVLKATHSDRLVFWSFTDKSNWMDYVKGSPRWVRADGDPHHRPGLFDENMQPKMAYSAVVDAIQQACHSY
jgi:endo-1,4-beta-xylanase